MANVVLTRAKGHTQCEIDDAVSKALDTLDYVLDDKIGLVVIKPNLCYYWDYSTGETTDPKVVSAVVDWIRQRIGKSISIVVVEADASAMRTKHVFKMLGFTKLSKEKNVKLVNLSEGEIVDREVVVAGEKHVLPVNKMLLDADFIINVPKLKFGRRVGLTCALKNMFGAIAKPKKHVYHNRLASIIVGVNKIVKSNVVLVDGIIGLGKTPKKIGVIITSDDALAADFIGAKAIGIAPSRIGYLRLGMKERIGDVSALNLIENPVKLEDIKREFPKQNFLLQKLSWKLQLKMLRLYSKMSNDVIPPVLDGVE
jgi:uncharacterized protein (DUF362 family)